MARRKKELTAATTSATTKKEKNSTPTSETVAKVEPTKRSTRKKRPPNRDGFIVEHVGVEEDGGKSSVDDLLCEESEMSMNAEDIQNIVVGDLKTVCVTKAASDDETDTNPRKFCSLDTQEAAKESIPISQPPQPRVECEHPKKKIVRLLNAGRLVDSGELFLNGGEMKTNSYSPLAEVKQEPSATPPVQKDFVKSELSFNPFSSRYNGEIPFLSELKNPQYESKLTADELICDVKQPIEKEVTSALCFKPPQEPVSQAKSYSPTVREMSTLSDQSEMPVSQDVRTKTEPAQFAESTDEDFLLAISDDVDEKQKSGSELFSIEEPLSERLSSVSLTSGAAEVTPAPPGTCGDKTLEASRESVVGDEKHSQFSDGNADGKKSGISIFDFMCVDDIDNAVKSKAAESSLKMPKSSKSLDRERSDDKNHVIPEKSKTDLEKAKKNEEKTKKSTKKESNNKQGKKAVDNKDNNKSSRDDRKDDAEKRRRSTRLKSKPEYERYEEVLQSITKCDIDRVTSSTDNGSKSDNVQEKYAEKYENKTSAIISVDPSELPVFAHILENEYHTERTFSKNAERMICDCMLTKEEVIRGEKGCGEDCLNRLLLIECCSRCTLGERCSNKRFQKHAYTKCEVFKTNKKGNGLRVLEDIPSGSFIMEYVGEVIDSDEFERRAMEYAHEKIPHFYFMSLKSDCIIDATIRGNCSRFINHSCEPNAETQKWTVQGELRIGFFSKRDISAGEEITFDYQLQRYGKQAQRCYCETASCTGWIGDDPDKVTDEDKPKERKKKKQRDQYPDLDAFLDEICQVGLINRHQTLSLNRLMVHAKELPVRMQILQLIEEGHPACRRLFVDYHGLPILWGWMVDCTSEQDELKIQLLKTLMSLPITNKTIVVDSKMYAHVEQWAFGVDQKLQSEALSAQSVLESVEDIASADETPVSELAQQLLNVWSNLREAYRIPKKERIQQMKEHEREADQNTEKPRPRRLPLYAEKMRDRFQRNRYNRDKDFDKVYVDRWKRRDSPDGRGHEHRDHHHHHRKSDYKESSHGSSISKQERRYMFEKQFREKDEKRRWEEEEQQKFWLQHNPGLYYAQQHQMMAGQFVGSVPSTPYSSEASYSDLSCILQGIQSISSAASSSHSYYATPTSYISPNMVLPQVSPSPQSYYSNSVAYPSNSSSTAPAPVSFPHQAIVELANTVRSEAKGEKGYTAYDLQLLQQQSPATNEQQPQQQSNSSSSLADGNSAYSSFNGSSLFRNGSASEAEKTEQYTDGGEADADADKTRGIALMKAVDKDVSKIKLPSGWKATQDSLGRMYFYQRKTKLSLWYPPPGSELIPDEPSDEEDSNDENGSANEEAEEDEQESKKRRKMYDDEEAVSGKRLKDGSEKESFEMDPELKENSAAMSCVFQQYSDDEDYATAVKGVEDGKGIENEVEQANTSLTSVPLVTEHIISPRERIGKEERRKNKKRIKMLKELLKQGKKRKLQSTDDPSVALSGGESNGSTNSISSSSNLLSVPADTSSITDRKKKEAFRSIMANYVVHCLNPYFKKTCTTGRITNYDDFKHLARKLTHFVMVKELKHCRSVTDLTCNSSVKHKAKEYIRKYMSKFGEEYVRPPDDNINY